MRKILYLFIIALLIMPQFVIAEETERRYVVTYQETNIRESASTSSVKVARVSSDKEYEIVSEHKDTDGRIWYEIALTPDQSAFVASWVVDVKTTKQPEKVDGRMVVIDPAPFSVNIRSGPSKSYDISLKVDSRSSFKIIAQQETPDLWYQIDIGEGETGWVKAVVVENVISSDVTKEDVLDMVVHIRQNVYIREQPSTKSAHITRTSSPIQPVVLSKTTGKDDGMTWYEIKLPTGKIGWVRSDVSTLTAKESPTSLSQTSATVPPNLNVREEPGTGKDDVIFKTKSEKKYSVLAKVPDINGDIWYQVDTEHGSGWVSGSHVKISSTSEFNTVSAGAQLKLSPSDGAKLIHRQKTDIRCGISGSAVDTSGDVWYLITTQDGVTGWVVSNDITVKTGVDTPQLVTGNESITIQRKTNLAPFPSSKDGIILYPSAAGKITASAVRDGGTLYYRIICGDDIGWVQAETTRKTYETGGPFAVSVGNVEYTINGQINQFRIPISAQPVIHTKNYKDDARINVFLENSLYEGNQNEMIKVNSSLVSGILVKQLTNPPSLLLQFKLNSEADYHMYDINANSEEIRLEIFEPPKEDEIKVYIQGEPVFSNTPPILIDDNVMIALESLANKLDTPAKINKKDGSATLNTDKVTLNFYANKSNVEFIGHFDNSKGQDNQFVPSPRFTNDDDEVFIVPIAPLATHLDFDYNFFPQKMEVHLDPIIDRIEIGGCLNESNACRTIETSVSTIADYSSETLPDGRERIIINNSVLGRNATANLDDEKVTVKFSERTAYSPPIVTLDIVKNENERISIGELRSPNRLIIQLFERIQSGLRGKEILLDPGHGNLVIEGIYDYGCVSTGGMKESVFSLMLAQAIQKKLAEEGAKATITRNTETSEQASLDDRVNQANGGGSHMFISIHAGFSSDLSVQGCRTYYHAPLGERLAEFVQPSLVRATKFPNLGYHKASYYLCRKVSGIPSVIIEPLFLSNDSIDDWLKNMNNIERLATEIVEGITRYYEEIP